MKTKETELTEAEITANSIQLIKTCQAQVSLAIPKAGLRGHEPHVLNVINFHLLALICTADLLAGKFTKESER